MFSTTYQTPYLHNEVLIPPPLPEITKRKIICGVVEGFYGRPWTSEQRRHLFERLKRLGMNTYVYAPKDDVKHRAAWKEMYNNEEIEVLQELITAANNAGVTFVYSLSPGLEIVYSNQKDIDRIKEKLEQVRSLGCKAFALLFDDIESDMQECDKKKFVTFASAQVSVTNEVYQYLDSPEFYFCPTEYCESRAKPTLNDSEYLTTVGKNLINDIHVLWTGPRVISRLITVSHVRKVAEIIKRKPVIWDNLHANDYDPKRVFMGPFSGRSVSVKDEIAGLLLNPNCKYESNFVPLHTLSDWNACDADAPEQFLITTDTVMEAGGKSPVLCLAVDSAKPINLYHPLHSLRNAVSLWMEEFNNSSGPSIPPVPRFDSADINMDVAKETDGATPSCETEHNDQTVQLEDCIQAVVLAVPEDTVNSLTADYIEVMDTKHNLDEMSEQNGDSSGTTDEIMEAESVMLTDQEQVSVLVDMFFLPFENGRRANEIMEQFAWLHENAYIMTNSTEMDSVESLEILQAEWIRRYDHMLHWIEKQRKIFRFVIECQNKALVSEIIPYVWEAHGICALLLGIAKFMKNGGITHKNYLDFDQWSPIRFQGEEEPWTVQGGFISDVHKMVSCGTELISLLSNKGLLPLSIVDYSIRHISFSEINELTSLASVDSSRTKEQNDLNRTLFLDKYILPYARIDDKYIFVIDDEIVPDRPKVMCSAIAMKQASMFFNDVPKNVEELQNKYNGMNVESVNMSTLANEIETWFPKISDELLEVFPSFLDLRFNVDAYEAVPAKKLIHAVCASLVMTGSTGVCTAIPIAETERLQYFVRIGFTELGHTDDGAYFLLGQRFAKLQQPNVGNEISNM